ncbi:hypothetical protein FKM82_021735 [Ascaphus truei]
MSYFLLNLHLVHCQSLLMLNMVQFLYCPLSLYVTYWNNHILPLIVTYGTFRGHLFYIKCATMLVSSCSILHGGTIISMLPFLLCMLHGGTIPAHFFFLIMGWYSPCPALCYGGEVQSMLPFMLWDGAIPAPL